MPASVYIQVLLATFLWGTAFPVAKVLLRDIGPLTLAGLRFSLAGCLLVIVAAATDKRAVQKHPSAPKPVDWLRILLIGLLSTFSFYGLFFLGMNLTSAASGAAVDAAGPVVTALTAHFVLRDDKLTRRRGAAILLAFVGILIIAFARGHSGAEVSAAGCGLILLGLVFSACGTMLVITYRGRFSLLKLTGSQMLIGGIMLTFAAAATEAPWQKVHLVSRVAPGLLWLAVVSAVAFTLWYGLIRRYKVASLSVFSFLTGLWGVALSVAFLREPVSPAFAIGLLCVVGGVVAMQFDKATHHRTQPDA